MIQFKNIKQNTFRIDITSLIDVVFLIIVFLILSLGKVSSFLNIQLPKLEESYSQSEMNIPILSIYKSESGHYNILWNNKSIELFEMESLIRTNKLEKIILKCDKDVPYGFLMQIFEKIQKNQNIELLLEYEQNYK
jgi:biopolymer transport protein ExbD